MNDITEQQVGIAMEYFRRNELGDGSVAELFTADVEVYFPTFGRARGLDAVGRIGARIVPRQRRILHVRDSLVVTAQPGRVVVDGVLVGTTADGHDWPAAGEPEVRFCNVFEFEGARISALRLYVDPDLAGIGSVRFPKEGDPA